MNKKKSMNKAFAIAMSSMCFTGAVAQPAQLLQLDKTEDAKINLNNESEKINKNISIAKNRLNLRTNPTMENDENIILTMSKGSKVEILSKNGEWAKVKYDNQEGYANLQYLEQTAVNAKTANVTQAKVTANTLNLRANAGTKYKILLTVKKNTIVDVYSRSGSWSKVKYNNKYYYANNAYLQEIKDKSSTVNKQMEVYKTNSLNVRSGPSTSYSIRGRLSGGTKISVVSISNGWAKFQYNGLAGYVSVQYLKDVKTSNPGNTTTNATKNETLAYNATVRSGAGTKYSIVGTIKAGNTVKVIKKLSNGWSEISYNGKVCYIETSKIGKKEETPNTQAPTDSYTAYKNEVLRLVNIERAKAGLGALTMDSTVSKVAQLKSKDMADTNTFNHVSLKYGTPFEMMKSYGIKYSVAGENIARGHTSAQSVVKAWMNSESHKKNIMNPRYKKLGMGIAKSSSGTLYWTQMFIG